MAAALRIIRQRRPQLAAPLHLPHTCVLQQYVAVAAAARTLGHHREEPDQSMRCALRTACTNSELLCLLVCYMPLAAAKPKQIVAAAVAVSWFSRISINRNRSVVAGRGALIGLRRPLDRSRMGEVGRGTARRPVEPPAPAPSFGARANYDPVLDE